MKTWRASCGKLGQILHGAADFDSALMDRLADLSQVLRAVVTAALKGALGAPPDYPPIVQYGQLSVSPHMGLGGERSIENGDLDWPSETAAGTGLGWSSLRRRSRRLGTAPKATCLADRSADASPSPFVWPLAR